MNDTNSSSNSKVLPSFKDQAQSVHRCSANGRERRNVHTEADAIAMSNSKVLPSYKDQAQSVRRSSANDRESRNVHTEADAIAIAIPIDELIQENDTPVVGTTSTRPAHSSNEEIAVDIPFASSTAPKRHDVARSTYRTSLNWERRKHIKVFALIVIAVVLATAISVGVYCGQGNCTSDKDTEESPVVKYPTSSPFTSRPNLASFPTPAPSEYPAPTPLPDPVTLLTPIPSTDSTRTPTRNSPTPDPLPEPTRTPFTNPPTPDLLSEPTRTNFTNLQPARSAQQILVHLHAPPRRLSWSLPRSRRTRRL